MSDLSDYVNAVLLKGQKDDGSLANIKIDDFGRLYAVLKALYGTEYKDLKCDVDGSLKLNIAAQLLDYTTSRSTRGGGQLGYGDTTVNANSWNDLVTINGKGVIYGGMTFGDCGSNVSGDYIKLTIDGGLVFNASWSTLAKYNVSHYGDFVAWLSEYDTINNRYFMNIRYGITFESQVTLSYFESYGNTPTISYNIVYGLMS